MIIIAIIIKRVDFLRNPLGFYTDLRYRDGGLVANREMGVGREGREGGRGALACLEPPVSCHREPTFSFCFSYYYVTESLAALKIQYYKLIVMLPH